MIINKALQDKLSTQSDKADFMLRLATGLFLMPHGAQKLFGWFGGYGLDATGQFFTQQLGFSYGYLAALGAGSVEFFGGLALALGLFTRLSAIAISILLLVAIPVHISNGFFWTSGGYEYPLLWLIIALSFIAKGGASYSIDNLIAAKKV
jgi:putative oxidoreductase